MVLMAPFTDLGTRILFSIFSTAGKIAPVEIQYTSGSLFGTLQLSYFGLETETVEIELNEITLQMEMGCLWRSKFCFEKIRAEHLEIRLPVRDDASSPIPAPALTKAKQDAVRE